MKRSFWIALLFMLCLTSFYLVKELPIWNREPVLDIVPSPELRLSFAKKLEEVTLQFPSKQMEIWLSGAARPIQWKKSSSLFYLSREKGQFKFGGHVQDWETIRLVPSDGQFVYDGKSYEGELIFYPTDEKSFQLVLSLEMENYISKVVSREMSSHWPLETLKAQAIAARSFAYYHREKNKGEPYHLLMGAQAQALSNSKATPKALRATVATKDMVLKQSGRTYLAYYHSTCGGETRKFKQGVFDYVNVPCEHCRNSPHYHWDLTIDIDKIHSMLAGHLSKGSQIVHAKVLVEESGHVQKVVFTPQNGKAISIGALDFRRHLNRFLGKEPVKSLRFDLHVKAGRLKILGRGWGYHGIGLCQYGSRSMGEKYWTCRSILEYYYPSASIELVQSER